MAASAPLPAPEGPLSVSGAPNLPAGFTDTFTSRYVDTGELRLHAVVGGEGPPLLLVHGRPENLVALMDVLGHQRFAVVGHDTGYFISSSCEGTRTSSSATSSPSRAGSRCPTTWSATTSASSPTPTSCAAASGSTATGTPCSRRTSSAGPGRSRCPSWRSAGPRAGARQWGRGWSPPRTTCRPWASPAPGHRVAEQAPDEMLAALTAFLAPYRG